MDELEVKKKIEYEEFPLFDPIHGFVVITNAEKEILNSIFFQRLREINQLGLAHFVFLGAVHKRTSHSVGVLAIVTKILQKLQTINESKNGNKTNNNKDAVRLNDFDIWKLRMAALLHDIGHYPYSHLMETVYKKDLEKENAHHENLGAYIILNTNYDGGITKILSSYFTREIIEDIAEIIQGRSNTNWYNQLIHSELDADRMDYLLRDSHNTGVEYGTFDLDYLINNLRLVHDDAGELVLVLRSTALFTAEHFLLSRYFWFAQIISHRSICSFDKMARSVFKWLIEQNFAYSLDHVKNLIRTDPIMFFKYNDQYFWERIYWLAESKDDKIKKVKFYEVYQQLALMLIYRKPLKKFSSPLRKKLVFKNNECTTVMNCTGECTAANCPKRIEISETIEAQHKEIKESVEDSLAQIEDSYKLLSMGYYEKVSVSKLSSERNQYEQKSDPIKILDIYTDKIQNIDEVNSSLINRLNRIELNISRIYALEELHDLITDRKD